MEKMNRNKKTPNQFKHLRWTIVGLLIVYLIGFLTLPLAIMMTPTNSAAPLVNINNTIYAPLVVELTKIPVVCDAWKTYIHFLCETTHYSCQ